MTKLKNLLESDIVNHTKLSELNLSDLYKSSDPISWLIANEVPRSTTKFFHQLAEFFQLEYIHQPPLKLNPKDSIYKIFSPSFLTKHGIYPYFQNNQAYLATTNPFLSDELKEEIQSKFNKNFTTQITSTSAIRNTIVYTYRLYSSQIAEEALDHSPASFASSRTILSKSNRLRIASTILTIIIISIILPHQTFLTFFALTNLFYFILSLIKPIVFWCSICKKNLFKFTPPQTQKSSR